MNSKKQKRQNNLLKLISHPSNDVKSWFYTFMCMNIPIAGWIYLYRLAFGKTENDLRDFAKAYLFYKLVFLAVGLVIVVILLFIGLNAFDRLIAYMELL